MSIPSPAERPVSTAGEFMFGAVDGVFGSGDHQRPTDCLAAVLE